MLQAAHFCGNYSNFGCTRSDFFACLEEQKALTKLTVVPEPSTIPERRKKTTTTTKNSSTKS